MRIIAVALLWLLTTSHAYAVDVDWSRWEAFLDEVKQEAISIGLDAQVVSAALDGLEPLKRAVANDRHQAEFKQTLEEYMERRVSQARIDNGRKMMQEHADLLGRVWASYGVQPQYVVAIWGMETNYGLYELKMDAIRALATMAYDKRRAKYFRKELMAALRILSEGHVPVGGLKGSWAGALGQNQFMPSNFFRYAQDFDGDGRKDIWNSEADILASIAYYLSAHGWRGGYEWGLRVVTPSEIEQTVLPYRSQPPRGCRAMKSHTQRLDAKVWSGLGIRNQVGGALPEFAAPTSLVMPEGEGGPAFLASSNYKVLTDYNCANLYALSIGHLADAIR